MTGWTLEEVVEVVVCRYSNLQETPEAERGRCLSLRWAHQVSSVKKKEVNMVVERFCIVRITSVLHAL